MFNAKSQHPPRSINPYPANVENIVSS